MTKGKTICNVLKTIRKQVADANDIKYEPRECHHQGECRGTCPACEAEVRHIEQQLDIRRQLGKAVAVVGLSAGLFALTGCTCCSNHGSDVTAGDIEMETLTEGKIAMPDSLQTTGELIDTVNIEPIDTVESIPFPACSN